MTEYIYKKDKNHNGVDVVHYIETRLCGFCARNNFIRDMSKTLNEGYGSRISYSVKSILAGGISDGAFLCDSCLALGGRISEIKKLNTEIKKLEKLREKTAEPLKEALESLILCGER